METMIKESRCEIFTTSRGKETDRIFKAKTFFCTSNSSTPQLLNRQKTSNSFKSLNNIEQIELETNDIYQFNHRSSKLAVTSNTTDIINPIIKEKRSKLTNSKILQDTGSDTYRDNEELDEFNLNNNNNNNNINSSSSNTKSEKKLAGVEKQKTAAKLKNNVANKLSKQKSELSSTNNLSSLRDANNLINNFTTNSLIATKLSYGGEKNQKQKKSKKSKNKSKNNKNAGMTGTESGINDMFRVTEMNAAKMKLKPSESSHKLNSKSKANGSNSNGINAMNNNNNHSSGFEGLNRTTSALDKDYLVNESLRWQHELDNEEEELKRIELYKINRRKRYIEQRNKYLMLSNNSSSFLPYLHYENDSPREGQQSKANHKASNDCEHTRDASKEIKLVEADGAFVETDKHGNNTLKEVNAKLTDSAISSLSSTSR
jgi:hypothetical protein